MKFAIYSRKSVYTGKGESIENQIGMCKQYIFTKFAGVAGSDITVYEDEGFSAKNTDRPQFQKMLQDIRLKRFDFVVCYRLDRISRNVGDFSALIEDLHDREISFICIKEEFDTSKPMGKAMMYIASVFAQLERETIAERVRDNMLMLARTGRWLGGATPTGFTSEKTQEIIIDGKVKSSCKLKTNALEIAHVEVMFEKFLELRSVSGVSKFLIKQNIKSRSGGFHSLPGIKEILQNPVYCIADRDALEYFTAQNADVCFKEKECSDKLGLLSYNKRDYKKKHAPRQPMERWIIAVGKHKGLVSGKKWVAVQNILKENKPDGKKPAKMHNDYSLLSGLIFCGKCGKRMFAKTRSARGSRHGLFDYMCNSKMRGGMALCDCRNINGRQADDSMCAHLVQYADENSNIYTLLEKLKKNLQGEIRENPLVAIGAQIKKYRDEMNNLIQALSQGNLGTAFVRRVHTKITELDRNINHLAGQREQLQKDGNLIGGGEIQADRITQTLSGLKNSFSELTIYEKRAFVRLLVKKIVWDGKELHIFIGGA